MTQATRTLVSLLGFLVVGGAVALYAFYGVFESDKKEGQLKDLDDRLFQPTKLGEKKADGGYADAEFVKLTVTAKGDVTVLERTPPDRWRIVSPVKAPADKIALDALVSQLQQSKFKRVIEENPSPEAVKKYGLDKPDFVVEAVAEVGSSKEQRQVKLEAGIENTYDGSLYMRRNGEPKVLSAEGGVKWTLGKSTFELREKELFELDAAKLKSLEVKGRNNEYLITADDKRQWKVTARRWAGMKPGGGEATFDGDPITITGTLQGVKNEKAVAFPADSPEARRAFDSPTLEATLTLPGDVKLKVKLVQPEADAGGTSRVLRDLAGDVVLAEVSGGALAALDRLPTDFRDKRLMPFKKEEVAKILFHTSSGVDIVAEKAAPDAGSADSWQIVSPKAGPAKTMKIASLLWVFGALKGTKAVDENPKDPGKYGFDARSRAVTLYDASGKSFAHFEVGKPVPDAPPGTNYMRGTRNEVVEGEAGRLTDFPNSPDDLIDAPAPVLDGGSSH